MADENGLKSGWRTSEFWLTLSAVVIGALVASGVLVDIGETWHRLAGAALSVLAALGYTAGRSSIKKGVQGIFLVLILATSLGACAPTWQGRAQESINAIHLTGVAARQSLEIVCRKPLDECSAAGKVYAECPRLHVCQDKRSEGYKALIVVQRSLLLASEGVRLADEPSVTAAILAARRAVEQVMAMLKMYGVTL